MLSCGMEAIFALGVEVSRSDAIGASSLAAGELGAAWVAFALFLRTADGEPRRPALSTDGVSLAFLDTGECASVSGAESGLSLWLPPGDGVGWLAPEAVGAEGRGVFWAVDADPDAEGFFNEDLEASGLSEEGMLDFPLSFFPEEERSLRGMVDRWADVMFICRL